MVGTIVGVIIKVNGEKIPRFCILPESQLEVKIGAQVGFDLGIGRNVHNLRVIITNEMESSIGAIRSDKED